VQDKVKAAGETTKFVTACVATTPALSVTCNVNEYVPAAVGVPVIAPLVPFTLSQLG
jgi:hypothetical protein